MKEKELTKIRKNNMKLYPIYKMIGLDWIFYYGVEILFLTQVKQIEPADIVLASSIFAFFCIVFQIPSVIVLEKIGKKWNCDRASYDCNFNDIDYDMP